MVKVQLGINLRSGKITVSQQFLHSTDIARCLQKMGGVTVAHHVRRDMAGTAHAHRPRLQAWAVRVGSASHISPHMMRHSYATHLLQASGDIRAVQELLGHSNLSATQVYTKLDFDHLARVYDEAHPRAKRKK